MRIDPKTLEVTKTVGLGFEPTDLAGERDHVWVVGGYDHTVWRIDSDGEARLKFEFAERFGPLPPGFERGPAGIAVHGTSVWVSHGDEVTEFDADSGAVRRTVRAGGRWHREIATNGAAGLGGLQRRDATGGRAPRAGIDPIDSRTGRRRDRVELVSDTSEIVFESGQLWALVRVTAAACSSIRRQGNCYGPCRSATGPRARLRRSLALGHEREGRNTPPPPPPPRSQRHADDREGEVEDRHVAQVAEVVVVHRREDDVGAGDAEERAEERERAGGGGRQRAADPEVAPVAVRVRRSPALSLRISPTVIARMASARMAPAAVAMAMTSRRRLALSLDLDREAGVGRDVAGVGDLVARQGRLDSTSQPAGICFQPWRRRPSSVMKFGGVAAVGAEEVPAGLDPLDVRDGELLAARHARDDELVGRRRCGRRGSPCSDRPWRGRFRGT